MATLLCVEKYSESLRDKWDKFVLETSINGTMLQTRRFLEYHPVDRFNDNSLVFFKGSEIVAVIPANMVCDNKKKLLSHQGSTYGGLILGKNYSKVNDLETIIQALNSYLQDEKYDEIVLKQTGSIYQKCNSDVIDYFLFKDGYECSQEIGFFINLQQYPDDIISAYTSSRRRDYRYSLKNEFVFRELGNHEIDMFYEVLCDNYTKFGKKPIHSLDELVDLATNRLVKEIAFYGIFYQNDIIASSMVFKFSDKVFHTQYLAVRQEYKNLFVNEFLYTNLIQKAREEEYGIISFGTSTFEGGKVLNMPLAQFKEGFGTEPYINRTYKKTI